MSNFDELSAWQKCALKLIESYDGYGFIGYHNETNDTVLTMGHQSELCVHVRADGNIENMAGEVTKFSEDPGTKLYQFISYMTLFSPKQYEWLLEDED